MRSGDGPAIRLGSDASDLDADGSPVGSAEPPSDAELLAGCRLGDEDAWSMLVERYGRLVFSVALRNGLTREDAADVTQTTFAALLESIAQLREDERLAWWLMSVSRRQAWRIRRRYDHELVTQDHHGEPLDPVRDWEAVAEVHEALSQLHAPCRELLTALYFDPAEPSYAKVAAQLGRPIGAIGPMRSRCLVRLRAVLEREAV